MLEFFSNNAWFVHEYWPENRPRVLRFIADLQRYCPTPASVFEPGCGNGYISFLASRLGYRVTAADAWEPPERPELFRRAGVESFACNLNDPEPWPQIEPGSFDAVLFGEVFEHLLNHPLGVLKEIARVLRPGAVVILSTPNPSTLINAVRVLFDRHSLWGTEEFALNPKFRDGQIIDLGEVHYREYRSIELQHYIGVAGLKIEYVGYMGIGLPKSGSWKKRLVKRVLTLAGLRDSRLFSVENYLVARKPY